MTITKTADPTSDAPVTHDNAAPCPEALAWNSRLRKKAGELARLAADPAHDLAHFQRVVGTSLRLCRDEGADVWVVLPAAWLHDFIAVPKNDPRRPRASLLSADAACDYLRECGYPGDRLEAIHHAIVAHSFSAGVTPRTLEAKIVQDADRLDALGAIGLARCFSVGGQLQRPFYDAMDPWARARPWDDRANTLDHFFVKLLKIAGTMQTPSGREEADRRVNFLRAFLTQLETEIGEIPRD